MLSGLVTLQTDPSTWTIPPAGKTNLGFNSAGQIVTQQSDGSITVFNAAALSGQLLNSAAPGLLTVSPQGADHQVITTISGSAREVDIVIAPNVALNFWETDILFDLTNAGAGFTINVYNSIVSGTPLFSLQTNSELQNALFTAIFASGAWQPKTALVPASS